MLLNWPNRVQSGGTLIGFNHIRTTLNVSGEWEAYNSLAASQINIDGAGNISVISDASNVAMPGVVSRDTSQWVSDGILTVAAVPKPSTCALIVGALALGVIACRRRRA